MVGTVIAKVAGSSLGATYTMPAADGAAGEFLKTDGSTNLSFASAAAGFHRVVVKTASDATYSPDTGVTKIVVEGVGGGGGGGNTTVGTGCAGPGGGGYFMKKLDVTSSYVINVQIGAGGTTGAAGGDGGDTTVTYVSGGVSFSTLTASGGDYGQVNSAADGGAGGTATNGDLNIQGGNGGMPAGGAYDARGGSSMFGFGGEHGQGNPGSRSGTGYGSAPSGGAANTGTGKAGQQGLVIIWEYK
jgi:hypothetical protein